jgi:Family of unknown function (DUF6152)
MKTRLTRVFVALVAGTALPVIAHHSTNMFDPEKTLVLDGVVKTFQWTNPHTWIQLDVDNGKGGVQEWSIEGGSPNLVGRQGWKRNSFKTGDKVKITVRPLRNGDPGGSFVSAEFADGRKLGVMRAAVPATPATAY